MRRWVYKLGHLVDDRSDNQRRGVDLSFRCGTWPRDRGGGGEGFEFINNERPSLEFGTGVSLVKALCLRLWGNGYS